MAQPTPYTREFNFSNQQAATPAAPIPAGHLDAELNRVKLTLDQTLANLELIQDDEGDLIGSALADNSVGFDQLAPEVVTEINTDGGTPEAFLAAFENTESALPLATEGIAYTRGVTADNASVLVPAHYLTPEMFEAVGDGTTVDDAALTAWVLACNATGLTAVGTPGARYRCSSALLLTVRVSFNGNGAIFVVPNDGQTGHSLFDFESAAADVEAVSSATVNTWTGLTKGSRQIPELTERDWAYSFYSTDEVILQRGSAGSLSYGEAFATVDDDGWLDNPLVRTYSTPFSNMTCVRRKIRAPIVIQGLVIEVISGTSDTLNRLVRTLRPNPEMHNCHVYNLSGDNIQQAFVAESTVNVRYVGCSASGLGIVNTEYGFNSNYSNRITYVDCWESDCRRGQDGHASKNVRVIRGNFPDGGGGHWIDGWTAEGAEFGFRNALNPRCIQIAGSNVAALNCVFNLDLVGQALCMRSDFPEISGYCIIRGGTIHIYDEGDTPIGAGDINVMQLQSYDTYDCLRTVEQPSYIEFTPDLVRQYGAASTNDINLVNIGCPKTAANFPQSVEVSGRALVAPGRLELDAGLMNGATPRVYVSFYKGETQIGDGMDVLVRNIPCLYVFSAPFSASVAGATGRASITVEDARQVSTFDLRYGATKLGRLRRCNAGSTLVRTGAVAALKDEAIDFEDFGSQHQGLNINPFGGIIQRGNGITVADGAYGADGWIGLNETGDLTFSVAAAVADGLPFMMRWANPDVGAKKLGTVSFIDSASSVALRSRLVTMMANLRSTAAITVNYAILEWTGTANTPTRDVVNDWADPDMVPGDFFIATTTNVLATGSVALAANTNKITEPLYAHVGSSCNNLSIVFWTDSTLAQNGYLQLAADLYPGFERPLLRRRSVSEERMRCLPWFRSIAMTLVSTSNSYVSLSPPTVKTPTVTATVGTPANPAVDGFNIAHSGSTATVVSVTADI